jgi:hypothetical protein
MDIAMRMSVTAMKLSRIYFEIGISEDKSSQREQLLAIWHHEDGIPCHNSPSDGSLMSRPYQ